MDTLQDILDLFYVEGDIMQTTFKFTCLMVCFLVIMDVVYILKSGIKNSAF